MKKFLEEFKAIANKRVVIFRPVSGTSRTPSPTDCLVVWSILFHG